MHHHALLLTTALAGPGAMMFTNRRRRLSAGRAVAEALSGAWRPDPLPLEIAPEGLEEIEPLVLANGGAGLLWCRLRGSALSHRPAASRLRQAFRFQAIRTAVQERQIQEVFRVLRAAGLEPVLAKGWAAARSYAEPLARGQGDIDVHVAPEHFESAAEVLGEHQRGRPERLGPVDLHRGAPDLDDRSWHRLLERSIVVLSGEMPVRIFAPADHLRYMCLHMLRHGGSRPTWLCDVAAMVESPPAELDWDHFLEGHPRRSEWALATLRMAGELLGARLEETPAAPGRSLSPPGWLVRTGLVEWGTHGAPREPVASLLSRPRLLGKELLRRWPNPIEATVALGAALDGLPRLTLQIADTLRRTARFATSRLD